MNLLSELRSLVMPENVIDNATALEAASIDESSLSPVLPAAIVRTFTSDEIQRVVRYCHQHKLPLTVRAAGSALEGSAIPCANGVVLEV